jgi:thioredoxin-like negative regulator of GroEL
MARRWIVLPVAGFSLIAGSVGGYTAWTAADPVGSTARQTVEDDGVNQTSSTIQAYLRACTRGHQAGNQWLETEVGSAASRGDLPRLLELYSGEDEPFRNNEEAAWQTCRGLLLADRIGELQHVRELWRGREEHGSIWLALDADTLLRMGRRGDARALLSEHSFPGVEDAGRLARLALAVDNSAEAHQLLNRALALAPDDADVRDCRGQRLEAEGRVAEAVADYSAALVTRGDDWVLRDRLANCYRRAGNCDAAVATWLPESGVVEQADFAWLRAWFWNRVLRRSDRDWEATAPTLGGLRSLAAHLTELPSDQFWTIGSRQRQGLREPVALRQETFWLRLLALLQSGREVEAAYVLDSGSYRPVSWQPDLEDAIDHVLTFRSGRPSRPLAATYRKDQHPFFNQLEQLASAGSLTRGSTALPADVARLLSGNEAFAALLLAAGWDEAALMLHHGETDLSRLPGWFGEGILRAQWANRGKHVALANVLRQRRTPSLDLVMGELLVAEGRRAEGLERLQSVVRSAEPETAARAAWQLAQVALAEKRPAEARQALEAYPRLTSNTEGLTLLARCAVAEGHEDRAEQLYRELADESAEARAYLARRAFAGGDWFSAGRLLHDRRP